MHSEGATKSDMTVSNTGKTIQSDTARPTNQASRTNNLFPKCTQGATVTYGSLVHAASIFELQ